MNRDRSSRDYTGSRPYTYHYDGALFDGPDQYVNLVLSSDGVLQSEAFDDDEEEQVDEEVDVKEVLSDNSVGHTGVVSDIEPFSRNQSYSSEPRGYIQVTHTTKNKNDARVTMSRTVPEILETLPSLDEAVLQPVPCESELYDKWARLPRTEPDSSRPSARSVTVTTKGWTILQSMQNQPQTDSAAAPAANDPALVALADEECPTLDSIIDHYNQMYLVQTGNAVPAAVKHGQLDVKRSEDDNSDLKTLTKNKSPQMLSPIVKKVNTTNSNSLSGQDSSTLNVNPVLPKKQPQHQSIPAATASIDLPHGSNQSDKIYQMARFWSFRPSKTSVKVQKNYKPAPNPIEKLDRNQKSLRKDKAIGRGTSKKSGPSLITSDTISTNKSPAAINNVRMNQLSTYAGDNTDDRLSPTRSRAMAIKSTSYNDGIETALRAESGVDGSRVANNHDHSQKITEIFLKPEYDFGKMKPSPRTSGGKQYKQTTSTSQTRAGAQARLRPRLSRIADAADSRSLVQRGVQINGDVEFLDFNELNLGHVSRVNHRQKNQSLAISLRGKSTDPKPTI